MYTGSVRFADEAQSPAMLCGHASRVKFHLPKGMTTIQPTEIVRRADTWSMHYHENGSGKD